MEKKVRIPNMTCAGCASRIEDSVTKLEGVTVKFISMADKQVKFSWRDNLSWDIIKSRLEEIDYPPLEEE